ncbi:MAG: hypothetical protein JO305_09070 [Alphaproteobacteria bacterium]|nr:hypothetical protein [Alphaproteobacteria bacterium]
MIVGRLLGGLLLLIGLMVLVRDLLVLADSGYWAPLGLGQWWYDIDRPGLNLAQAAIEQKLHPALWDPIATTVLSCWAFVPPLVLGLLLFLACRDRPRRRFRT